MNKSKFKQQILISITALSFVIYFPLKALAESNVLASTSSNIQLTKQAEEAAKLLGIEDDVKKFIVLKNNGKLNTFDKEAYVLQIKITKKVFAAGLELRTQSAKLDNEINTEMQALDKLTSQRDFAVALTTNANFLQLGILATIIDGPLAETHNKTSILNSNRLNIVSGLTVGGLALISLVEQRGWIRSSKAEPNMLGQTLGLDAPDDKKLTPMLWTYLNSTAPRSGTGLTRRELLLEYWKHGKILSINIKNPSTKEKVSALGPHHSKWSESINLINSRVTMLFDLRAMVDLLNTGLVELLEAMD